MSCRTTACCLLVFVVCLSNGRLCAAEIPVPSAPVSEFPLSQVKILEGPFKHAQDLDLRYVLALDPDRLLSGFRSEAGLEPKAPKYPNWESSGLDGHTAGHYLSALAMLWAATGEAEMKRRADYMIATLAECQQANGDGYVGAVPDSKKFWAAIRAGNFDVQNFSLKQAWVPWYNLHKTFAGLRDAWLIGKNSQARAVLIGLADWCADIVSGLSDEKLQAMLQAEHGGMNETLADVYGITGDPKYLQLAQRFSHRAMLDPLLHHEDKLTGLHANTQIPKIIGFARIAELGGDPQWHDAAAYFWDAVTGRRDVAFGGGSVREHFNPTDDFSSMLESREGPESCYTYNLLKLTAALFRAEPAAKLADYYERALFNHILSVQHPEHGGFVYFTPIRPQHYRVYSQPTQCFWCCVGTGMENPGKFGEFIYARAEDTLWVNLFIASELDWNERGLHLRQETQFPDESSTRLVFALDRPQTLALRVRHPGWVAAEDFAVRVNGEPMLARSAPCSYVEIKREWHGGDRVEIALPMRTALERLPDGSDYVAVLRGPIVLAARTAPAPQEGLIAGDARMGHIAPGAFIPLDEAPMLVGDPDKLVDAIQPVAGRPLTFTARDIITPAKFRDLELLPFFRVHDARYMLYWRATTPERYAEVVANLAAHEREQMALEARTVDKVAPGEQQPEVEHNFQSDRSTAGSNLGRSWRDAAGWFSYDLKALSSEALVLQTTTFDLDALAFAIEVNGRAIASVQQAAYQKQSEHFTERAHPIPQDLVAAARGGVLTVRFVATRPESRTGAIYGVRLIKN